MHTTVGGAGAPVVLLHGYGVSGHYMLPLARELAPSFTVYAPDLPGHGRTGHSRAPLGIASLADALDCWLDATGLVQPAFVANSMGCQVITELAVRVPERVGPLVLVGPTVDPKRRSGRHQVLGAVRDSAHEPLSLLAIAARDEASVGLRTLLAMARSALADRIEERLPLVEQATTIVRGGQDGFVDDEWVEQAVALLPRGRLVVVPGEPHAVHYTRPALVAGIVAEHLAAFGEQEQALPVFAPGAEQEAAVAGRATRGSEAAAVAAAY